MKGGKRVMRDASEAQHGRGGVVDCFGAEGAARAAALALSEGRRDT
jgi:hypothetical protein